VDAHLASSWRPTPRQLAQVLVGLWLFGVGEALVVASELGNSPWTVLAEGVSLHSPLSIGAATFAIGVVVLLCWIPLRTRPGLGTILNAIVIGVSIDVTLSILPPETALPVRWGSVFAGIACVGAGSGLYLTAALGPGPRDGIMTGLSRLYGWPLAGVRACIELTAVTLGVLLGGRAGIGSLLFALLVGPAVGLGVRVVGPRPAPAPAPAGSP
jgi:uncharacterized membrane protein YczE